ncbi:MAG TPA: HEAT repeat domain-containing protein [Anaerolineales bacterium]|nr:HEAT repeat domain-containing protein [Anaerolineales bacterium]
MDRSPGRSAPGPSPRLERLLALFSELITTQDEQTAGPLIARILLEESILPYLAGSLAVGDSNERWWAVRILSEIQGDEAADLIRKALFDADAEVRQCAALALRSRQDPRALTGLLGLLSEPDHLSARLAGDSLSELGSAAIPGLTEILTGGPPGARVEAARALALMDSLDAVPTLFECLEDESALVELWADEGLQRRGIGMTFFQG